MSSRFIRVAVTNVTLCYWKRAWNNLNTALTCTVGGPKPCVRDMSWVSVPFKKKLCVRCSNWPPFYLHSEHFPRRCRCSKTHPYFWVSCCINHKTINHHTTTDQIERSAGRWFGWCCVEKSPITFLICLKIRWILLLIFKICTVNIILFFIYDNHTVSFGGFLYHKA